MKIIIRNHDLAQVYYDLNAKQTKNGQCIVNEMVVTDNGDGTYAVEPIMGCSEPNEPR